MADQQEYGKNKCKMCWVPRIEETGGIAHFAMLDGRSYVMQGATIRRADIVVDGNDEVDFSKKRVRMSKKQRLKARRERLGIVAGQRRPV